MSDDIIMDATMLISASVRNHMEYFHVEHLSDEQMAELNPLVRQGVLEGLSLLFDPSRVDELRWLTMMIPTYWELPVLKTRSSYE